MQTTRLGGVGYGEDAKVVLEDGQALLVQLADPVTIQLRSRSIAERMINGVGMHGHFI